MKLGSAAVAFALGLTGLATAAGQEPPAEEAIVVVDRSAEPEGLAIEVVERDAEPVEPPPEETVQVGGWSSLRARQFPRLPPEGPAFAQLPVEAETVASRTYVEARYARGERFEVAISGELELEWLVWANPARPDERTHAAATANLRELYLAFFDSDLELRAGQQRLAWGTLDMVTVNDVVNARDLTDPFPENDALRDLPTPLLRVDYYPGALSLQALVGWFVPDRFELYGRRWASVQPDAPLPVRSLVRLLAANSHPSRQGAVASTLAVTDTPNTLREVVTAGAKAALASGDVDLAAYYHYGYDGTPYLTLAPEFQQALVATDWSTAGPSTLAPVLDLLEAGRAPYRSRYLRRHHVGADALAIAGRFALRAELGYDSERTFYQTDLTGFSSPVALAGAGIEYQTGDVDRLIALEASLLHALDPVPDLIGYARDTALLFANFRWPLVAGLGLAGRAMLGVLPSCWALQPELTFDEGDLELALGAALLGGEAFSVGGYYAHASNLYSTLTYSF